MSEEVTELLRSWRAGNEAALPALAESVQAELHRLAQRYMRRERHDHTLQPTALVNEAFVRLIGQDSVDWQGRTHFFAVAARIMRNILVDHARHVQAQKRGGELQTICLDDVDAAGRAREVDLVLLDDALDRLGQMDERQSRLVELRYFGGLTIEEVAEVLDCSPATVKREWRSARAWLKRELEPETR